MRRDPISQSIIRPAAMLGMLALAGAAQAGEVSFTESISNGVQSASATFTFNDDGPTTILTIQLTNTMTSNGGPQWLTGLFFDIAGSPTLTYDSSGLIASMITLSGTTQTAYTTVDADHFWALRDDLSGLPFGDQEYGLGSAGFDVFGSSDILNFQAGGPTPQPDGTDGGILADIAGLDIPDGHDGKPFVLGSLWLTFDLGSYDIDDAAVSDVAFVFGTGFDETVLLVPVPLALPLGLAGLAGVVLGRRRLSRVLAR